MSLLQRLLWGRAGHQELPSDLGDDPDPDEPEEPAPPQPSLHLTADDFRRAAEALNVPVATIRAVAEVEAAGRGFLPDGRPQILYESHIFGRLTNHRHGAAVDSRGRALSSRVWDRTLYGAAGAWQHDGRLAPAAQLDWEAGHRACSWGLFQVLGTNAEAVGWPGIREFVEAMMTGGAAAHLEAFAGFIRANNLAGYLRNRRWRDFARRYNGPGFAANQFDKRLAEAYRRFRSA